MLSEDYPAYLAGFRRPAVVAFAAGLLVIAAGTVGLLLTRHSTPAMRPPPRGVAALPAPTGPIAALPKSALPKSALPKSALPKSALPKSALPKSAGPQSARPVPVARPVSLTIPLIGVRTRLIRLGRTADGELQVPSSATVAGWYTGSPRPGAVGPAVIVGHVDSLTGPGVFYRLSELRPAIASTSCGPTGPRRSSASRRSRFT
jgi:hypothetical protein